MNLLLIVPFYKGDKGQALRLGKWINRLSGGAKVAEKVLLVSSFDTTIDPELTAIWAKSFNEVKSIKLRISPNLEFGQNPWPKAPNHQFLSVLEYINGQRPDVDAFYYMEPDNLPVSSDWFAKLKAEYEACGMPLMGARSKWIPGEHKGIEGHHMIGTGIYPQNAWAKFKFFEEMQRKEPNEPWDAHLAALTNPICYFTDLIAHQHHMRGVRHDGTCMAPVKRKERTILERVECDALKQTSAMVIHGCKDASLREAICWKIDPVGKSFEFDPPTFRHSGDLGDIIYALPSIKEKVGNGKGILYLAEKGGSREPLAPQRMQAIKALLQDQPYLTIEPDKEGEYVDFDFRYFRTSHLPGKNLALTHAEWVGASIYCFERPWLTVSDVKPTQQVVMNRTQRYRNPLFPWKKVVRESGRNGVFIGLPTEHLEFEDSFGSVNFIPTSNLLEAARLIAGSRLFVGNQSACFAIAEGLKHPRIQETFSEAPDCVFDSSSGTYVSDGELYWPDAKQEIKALENPLLETPVSFGPIVPLECGKSASLAEAILAECKANPSFVHKLKRLLANPPKRKYRKRKHAAEVK